MHKKITLFLLLLCLSVTCQSASHNPEQMLEAFRGKADEGEKIVTAFCATCHARKPLIELAAPKIQVDKDWRERLKQGLDTLLQHTADGYGAMPARGGCFECTDEQLRLAIEAMLPKKTIKKTKS